MNPHVEKRGSLYVAEDGSLKWYNPETGCMTVLAPPHVYKKPNLLRRALRRIWQRVSWWLEEIEPE